MIDKQVGGYDDLDEARQREWSERDAEDPIPTEYNSSTRVKATSTPLVPSDSGFYVCNPLG